MDFRLVLVTLFSLTSTAIAAQVSGYEEALLALQQNQTEKAYSLLEAVPMQETNFVPALLELQKIHYKRQEWDKFYAYATFYRVRIIENEARWKTQFRDELFALEALALAKFCLWDQALSVVSQGTKISKAIHSKQSFLMDQTQSYIELFRQYQTLDKSQKHAKVPHSVLSSTQHWRVSRDSLKHIPHPKFLKIHLNSACQD